VQLSDVNCRRELYQQEMNLRVIVLSSPRKAVIRLRAEGKDFMLLMIYVEDRLSVSAVLLLITFCYDDSIFLSHLSR